MKASIYTAIFSLALGCGVSTAVPKSSGSPGSVAQASHRNPPVHDPQGNLICPCDPTDPSDDCNGPDGDADGDDGCKVCVPGAACQLDIPCHLGALSCDEHPTCVDTGPAPDGTTCGGGNVCSGGACVPACQGRLPWDAPGVSTAYTIGTALYVISGDQYWVRDTSTATWTAQGRLEDLWAGAAPVDGLLPWQGPGVQAAYPYQSGLTVFSGVRYWIQDQSTGAWGQARLDDGVWGGVQRVDGIFPWEGQGLSAAYVYGRTQTVINGDRYWTLDVPTATWGVTGHLETAWSNVPAVDGLVPWQAEGIHAAYIDGSTETVISGPRYWVLDVPSATWTASGHLSDLWADAPRTACP